MNNPRITIAVFSKNENSTVGSVVGTILERYQPDNVVLVVSEENDPVRSLAREKGIRLLKDTGKGKGAAIRAVIEDIPADIFVFVDADGSHDIRDIPSLVRPLTEDTADMVIASRLKGGSEEFSGSLKDRIHCIGNYVSSFFVMLLWKDFRNGFLDCLNGFRAIKADAAKSLMLQTDAFEIELEMVIKCCKKKYRIADFPSFEFKRKDGKSHVRIFPNFIQCSICFARNLL